MSSTNNNHEMTDGGATGSAETPIAAASVASKRPHTDISASTATGTKKAAPASSALQQQIQQQLQEQLQQQLAAAAARGQQAHITPAHIQAQAAAMVQAAAQAQAVVAAAKTRAPNGQLQPMTAAQVAALSQIQAAAIVNSRKAAAAAAGTSSSPKLSDAQVQAQIQMQAQALVHAHTQALMQAGVYKGDVGITSVSSRTATSTNSSIAAGQPSPTTTSSSSGIQQVPPNKLTPAQAQQVQELKTAHAAERAACATAEQQAALEPPFQARLSALYEQFKRQGSTTMNRQMNSVAATSSMGNNALASSSAISVPSMGAIKVSAASPDAGMLGFDGGDDSMSMTTSTTPAAFALQMSSALTEFWTQSHAQIEGLQDQTEHDFKNHNDLPLARIKRIMKSDEDVRMIAAEAPVLLAKACELFILDVSIRAWNYSQWHKRRTLQKEDVKEAIQKTDIFDFLVDVIP